MFASYRPSGVTSKQVSGHCSQHSVHLMQVSKFTTGRIVRVENFLNVVLRPGLIPPITCVVGSSISLPTGMHGMAMPSPISCHFGSSNLYGSSGLPCPGFTATLAVKLYDFSADATFT